MINASAHALETTTNRLRGFLLALFWKAIHGATPPTLAPGTMIQPGLLGLASTHQHPALIASTKKRRIGEN